VPRFTQNSGSMDPDLSSTGIMNDGRSRVPVRTGYMYRGHTYTPRPAFFLFSAGLKWMMGMGQNSSCSGTRGVGVGGGGGRWDGVGSINRSKDRKGAEA
jgi:hypothetical protein